MLMILNLVIALFLWGCLEEVEEEVPEEKHQSSQQTEDPDANSQIDKDDDKNRKTSEGSDSSADGGESSETQSDKTTALQRVCEPKIDPFHVVEFVTILPPAIKFDKIDQRVYDFTKDCQIHKIADLIDRKKLDPYFDSKLLEDVKVILVKEFPFDFGDIQEFFSGEILANDHIGGMTYDNTVFLLDEVEDDVSIYFHELIHVLQYEILGKMEFLQSYGEEVLAVGYDNSFEQHAYELQQKFDDGTLPSGDLKPSVASRLSQ